MKWVIDVDVDTLNNCRLAIKNGLPTNEQTLIANGEAYYKCESIKEKQKDGIDNAPTIEPRIEYGTDGQPYRLSMSGGQVVPDTLQGWRYEE